jgi:hypothetical protein
LPAQRRAPHIVIDALPTRAEVLATHKKETIMKLIIAIAGMLICVGGACATPLAAPSNAGVSTVTDLSSRKVKRDQLKKIAPARRIVRSVARRTR